MKKLALLGIAVFTLVVLITSACSHSGDNTSTTSTPIPTTTTITLASSTTQATSTNQWVIEAKRASNFDPSESKKYFPVYNTPGGDQLRNLRDYVTPEGDQPSDPTVYGSRLTFLVLQTADEKGNKYPGGRPQDEWAEVILSTRPNNSRAWIRATDFDFKSYQYNIVVDISDRTVTVMEGDKVIEQVLAIVGKPSTPTPPIGLTYIEAKILNTNRNGAFGSRIFTLAAFSEILDDFEGDIPQLAIHGTSMTIEIGQALSSGSISIQNDIIDGLDEILIAGTPVTIVA